MCVMAVVGAAPCQCFSSGANETMSPGRISSTGPPQHWARPQPAITMSRWPNGCLCHAVRAPGSNVTLALATRAGSVAWNNGSMRTVPVNQSAGPFVDGCDPLRLISIFRIPFFNDQSSPPVSPDTALLAPRFFRSPNIVTTLRCCQSSSYRGAFNRDSVRQRIQSRSCFLSVLNTSLVTRIVVHLWKALLDEGSPCSPTSKPSS